MIIDLTHSITRDMTVFPGTPRPEFTSVRTVGENGYAEKKVSFYSHTGTHADAPAHMIQNGKTLDRFDISHFHGPALVIDLRNAAARPDAAIDRSFLAAFEQKIASSDFILFHTGWSRFWGTPEYLDGFPALTPKAARWLTRFPLKGIGLDTISADRMDTRDYPVHHTLLGTGMVIVENLTRLDRLPSDSVLFSCFPLPLADADGAAVRAVAHTKAD